MRNSKAFLAMMLVLLLLSVSIVALSVWGYNIYFADNHKPKDIPIASQRGQKALKSPGTELLAVLDNNGLISDTSELLRQKLAEIQRLQLEIQLILAKKDSSTDPDKEDLLKSLKDSIYRLKSRNEKIVVENQLLEKKISRLSKDLPGKKEARESVNIPKKKKENFSSASSAVRVSGLDFYGIKGADLPTSNASLVTAFQGRFVVKSGEGTSGELFMIIKKPDGKVLINSPWESGVFQSEDGNQIYSIKFHFDAPGQAVTFSLDASNPAKGTYTMEVYYKGKLIGLLKKTMS